MSEAEVQGMMWQLLDAVRYLHARHIWHRDLKSANALVTLHEGRRIAKVGGERGWAGGEDVGGRGEREVACVGGGAGQG